MQQQTCMYQTLSLCLPGQPTIRVRRVPAADRPLVVLQDVVVKLGEFSASSVARCIKSVEESIAREVAVHTGHEGGNDLHLAMLGTGIDLLVEVKVPAAQQLHRQLPELGKLVLSRDRDGVVAAEIQANKEWLDAMPTDQQLLLHKLLQPEVSPWDCYKHSTLG